MQKYGMMHYMTESCMSLGTRRFAIGKLAYRVEMQIAKPLLSISDKPSPALSVVHSKDAGKHATASFTGDAYCRGV